MKKSYSVSEARSHLAELVENAQKGKSVRLTKRGHAVAALVSIEDLRRITQKEHFFDKLVLFYESNPNQHLLDKDLARLRSRESGRDFLWQD